MAFHEIRFPVALSFGSLGGPERRTDVVTLASGFEERNTPWEHSRRRYDAGVGLRSLEDVEAVVAFFEARRGRLHGFRWKDWSDYRSARHGRETTAEDQEIGRGDDVQRVFQLVKSYRSGDAVYTRPIRKPVAGTVRVALSGTELVEGVEFTVDHGAGLVSFVNAPDSGAVITAGFDFDVPVRFDTDMIQVSVASFNAGQIPDIPVIEVRV